MVKIQNPSRLWFQWLFLLLLLFTGTAQAYKTGVVYFHNDALGSPLLASDEEGNILWHESCKPYGERIKNEAASQDNQHWFTGKEHDDSTGLSYFGARYYDPVVGRFMAVDPVGIQAGNVHSFNRYAYSNNNPYRFVDPDGRCPTGLMFDISQCLALIEGRDLSLYGGTDRKQTIEMAKTEGMALGAVSLGLVAPEVAMFLATRYPGTFAFGTEMAAAEAGLAVGATTGLVQNRMFKHALQEFRGGLMNAGRQLTKHPNIVGANSAQELIQGFGNNTGINNAAANALKNIMRNGTSTTKTTKAFGDVVDFKLPSGLGARFKTKTNEFVGFLGRGL